MGLKGLDRALVTQGRVLKNVNAVKNPRKHKDESALEEVQSNVQAQHSSSAAFPFGFFRLFVFLFLGVFSSIFFLSYHPATKHVPMAFSADHKHCKPSTAPVSQRFGIQMRARKS